MASKTITTTSEEKPQEAQASPTLTLSPLSEPAPALKREPKVEQSGDMIRIDY